MNQRNFFAVGTPRCGVRISMVDFRGGFRFKWYDHVDRTYESK